MGLGEFLIRHTTWRLGAVFIALCLASYCIAVEPSSKGRQHEREAWSSGPDLSGVWMGRADAITFNSKEPPMLPWAEAKYRDAKPGYGPHATADSQDPLLSCFPPGVPRILLLPFPMQIIQIPGEVLMLFEYDHFVRQIRTDHAKHPKSVDLTWMGDSIGKWEGDTLVVDTIGLNDKTWLDQVGHPHSNALHVIERIRRVDHDTLVDDVTIDDPKAYSKPWTGRQTFTLKPGWQIMEYVCEDNINFQYLQNKEKTQP